MSFFELGAARVLISELGGRDEPVKGAGGAEHEAWVVPALVVGAHQTLLEISLRRWIGGGEVVANSRGDSHIYFQRLVHGCRMGLREQSGGAASALVGAVRWDPVEEWANVKKVAMNDLDDLLGDAARPTLVGLGIDELATRAELWGDTSSKKFYLEARFDPDDPVPPLALYALTRVLPVLAAIDEVSQ
jgi:hypothetical protein